MPRNELDAILAADRMETSQLSAKDVCSILSTAKKFGVQSLEFSSLKVVFHPTTVEKKITVESPQEKQILAEVDREVHEANLANETSRLRQEEIANLLVTDPAKYEELLIQGELGGSEEEDDDSRAQ